MKQRFDLSGRLDGVKRTPLGGIKATANLTRVGVFTYYDAAGKPTRELRHPDQIFDAASLETLKGATLTIGHPGMVTPSSWKDHAIGHVGEDVRADGRFVKATVLIQDADACARAELGVTNPDDPRALVELSCGYEVDVVEESGSFDGETYDAKQVGHRYNHVAMGGAGWGRAGSSVRLTLDSAGNAQADSYTPPMTVKTDDNKDAQARLDAISGERDALKENLAATKVRADAAEAELARVKAEGAKLIDPTKIGELVAARVSIETNARAILGAGAKFDGKSDRDVMIAVLEKHAPGWKADGKSDEYLRARFDAATEVAVKADVAVDALGKASATGAGAPTKSRLDEANEKAEAERLASSNAGAPVGSITRKP